MPAPLPRSGPLPLSLSGRALSFELLSAFGAGIFRAGVLLWLFPLRDWGLEFYFWFSLIYWAVMLLPIYRKMSVSAASSNVDANLTEGESQQAQPQAQEQNEGLLDDLRRTQIQAAGFVSTWLVLGPARRVAWLAFVFFVGLWTGVCLVVGLGFVLAALAKRTSSPAVAAAARGAARLAPLWYAVVVDIHRTVLFGLEDALALAQAVGCFVLPWWLRRMGERVEAACRPRRWRAAVREVYEYGRLDHTKRQIRLLRIPRQRLFWGHLRCSLVTASMDDLPPFEALSYRWGFAGNPDQTELIFVNGRSLRIPVSAYQLLHACSSLWTDRLVWIDAICINQASAEEKSQQLPLMRDIYSQARKVVVWPGDEVDSGMAMATLQRVLAALLMFQAPEEETRDFFADEWDRRAWRAMTKLFENPYFTRMWVIQEVVRGSTVEIHHGGHALPWDWFALTSLQCIQPRRRAMLYGPKPATLARERALNEAMEGIGLMAGFRMAAEMGTLGDLHIGHLLFATAKSQATDPRDKIFSLSGLLSEKNALPAGLLDYTKPAAEVFLETAKIVLQQDRDPFALLGFAGIGWHAGHPSDLPSWAVDWSRKTLPTPFSEVDHYITAHLGQGERPPPPGPTATTRPTIQILTSGGSTCLLVRGAIVDRIHKDVAAVEQSPSSSSTTDTDTTTTRGRLRLSRARSSWYLSAENLALHHDHQSQPSSSTYPYTNQPLPEAFWRTIVADRSGPQHPAPSYFEACNKIYRELSLTRLRVYSAESEPDSHRHNNSQNSQKPQRKKEKKKEGGEEEPLKISEHPSLRALWPTELDKEAQFHEFGLAIGRAAENRRFVVGERGLMGLAPPLSRVGDLICLFDGAPTPFLLRERPDGVGGSGASGGGYWLVGECYVHGLMGGGEGVRDKFESRVLMIV